MKLWVDSAVFDSLPAIAVSDGSVGIGPEKMSRNISTCSASCSVLVGIEEVLGAKAIDSASVYIDSRNNTDLGLMSEIGELGMAKYLVVNGLGDHALNAAIEALGNTQVVTTFDSSNVDMELLLEQLAWLGNRPNPFAVRSNDTRQLKFAAIASAHAVIAPEVQGHEVLAIQQLTALRAPDQFRPLSGTEVDSRLEVEKTLTVTKSLAAGEALAPNVLGVEAMRNRGLGPHLSHLVIGKELRYAINPGEPLTFGHIV